MKKHWNVTGLVLLILAVALAACGKAPANPINGGADSVDGDLPPVAAIRAREMLAAELGADIEQIAIVASTQTTWQDSCLGLGGIAESCLRIDVEGWTVELSANGETYIARTDQLGDQVRFEPGRSAE